jgi:hypothetical protein
MRNFMMLLLGLAVSLPDGAADQAQSPSGGQLAHAILFRVVDSEVERGIAGATLNDKSVTDKDGRLSLDLVFPTSVRVKAPGFVPRFVIFAATDAYPAEYTFKLERGEHIGGHVRDEQGNPIPDVKVIIVGNLGFDPAVREQSGISGEGHFEMADGAGRWACNEIPRGMSPTSLKLVHSEHAPACFSTESLEVLGMDRIPKRVNLSDLREDKAILLMQRGIVVAGIVTDQAGKPVEGANVSKTDAMQHGQPGTRSTGPTGRFAFADAGPGKVTLTVHAKGLAPVSKTVDVAAGMPEVTVRLEKGNLIEGRVTDDQGKPIVGARVATEPTFVSGSLPQWSDKTDADGRFRWDSAPSEPLKFRVSAPGFMWSNPLTLEPGKPAEIKLRPLRTIQVSCKVVDSVTSQPIEKYRVLTSTNYISQMQEWMNYRWAGEGQSGNFRLRLDDAWPRYGIKIEAVGYLPSTPQAVEMKDGDRTLEISLVRGKNIAGIVLLPGGTPAKAAKVILVAGGAIPGAAGSASVFRPPTEMSVETDPTGRFSFNPVPEPHGISVSHEAGFAFLSAEGLTASPTMTLEPWSRIEGTLRIGRNPGVNETLRLSRMFPDRTAPREMQHSTTVSDTAGRFVFTRIAAGEYRIVRDLTPRPIVPGRGLQSQVTIVVVKPGETRAVAVGGQGRPVVGRILVSGSESPIDWRQNYNSMELKLPEVSSPYRDDPAANRAWLQSFYASEEGKQRLRSQRVYDFEIAADGSFRIEDVPAGEYILTFKVHGLPANYDPAIPNSIFGMRSELGSVSREVVVPAMAGGRSDEPLDVGVIALNLTGTR